MRILFISDFYPPHATGGYERRCEETVNEIGVRGHTVFVLTGQASSLEVHDKDNIYRLLNLSPFKDSTLPKLLPDFLRLNRRANQIKWAFQSRENYIIAAKLMDRLKPDIVFLWNMQDVGVAPILAAQDRKIATVYSLGAYWLIFLKNETFFESNIIKRLYQRIINGLKDFRSLDLSHLITNSEALKRSYIENGFGEKNITVIPRGIASELIYDNREHNIADQQTVKNKLLFVGRLTPDKAPDIAIRSIGYLVHKFGLPNIKLDLVGSGTEDYLRELNQIVLDLHLERNVEFLGSISREAVLNLYASYDSLIFPSRWEEPFAGTIVEAMARGLNVVATDRGGTAEIISNGKNGLLIPSDQPDALADAVLLLLKDQSLASKLRRAAFSTVREKFTLEKVNDRILNYLEDVLRRKTLEMTNDVT